MISSGDVEADFIAMLFEKASGNIEGVLRLMEEYPLSKIEKIYAFWVEITLPMEERERRMRKKADAAAQLAANELFDVKIEEEKDVIPEEDNPILERFLNVYKQKT